MNALKVPSLRFPEFSGEWEKTVIGKVLTIGSGRDYKHLSSGDVPVYGTGGYMLSVNDYLYDGESVCIGRKGTINKPVLISGKFWTVDTLFYTHSFVNVLPKFIYACFQRVNWKLYNEASGVPSLSKTTIECIELNIPSLPEQTKIAAFLSSVDSKIDQLSQKKTLLEQYKKGVMQQMFSQQIRFKADDGCDYPEWEEKTIADCIVESKIKGDTGDKATKLTVKLWNKGVFAKNEILSGSENTQYYIRKAGQFIYSKLDFLNCAFGVIPEQLDGYQSTIDLPCFDFINNTNPIFFLLRVSREDFYLRLGEQADGSRKARRINQNIFLEMPILLPSVEEQTKIASFLTAIDIKIEQVGQQLEAAKQFKKGLLQQMFV